MKVVYDISMLGVAHYYNVRAGHFRAAENILHSLANSKECDLSFCSSFSIKMLKYSLNYLKDNPQLDEIPFLSSKFEKYAHRKLSTLLGKVNSEPKLSLSLKIWRKLLII